MNLTEGNYYSTEANKHYASASFVKSFLKCPAAAMAEFNGEYDRGPSQALAMGSYVDAALTGDLVEYKKAHPEMLKRDGTPKAEFVKCDEMIEKAFGDELFMDYLNGDHQAIFTGEIDGVPFKAKFDVYRPGERIVDLKTTRDMGSQYVEGKGRVDFATAWDWPLQMAIYQTLEGSKLPCYLAVITKQDPPDIRVIQIPQERLDAEMAFLKEQLPLIDAVRRGVVAPKRCENCAYCRKTRKLTKVDVLDEDYVGGESNE